ncbi:u6 snRNA-associated sm-like protein lsm8 [Anaeramoeba flamelloides]|uniref:U6 snRNA-associated Sm-like protein LSm8 n=1 Tax=Anaeramoeba flamelloides TaxID=1746091 RepID=A0AAV8A121_9EUKA|nr:u6 snRNA-associated sm-like protein lsm8 [Anaeramoeba flamelloides]KAJ3446268.1 u6 snRNA-associated sm-like protein lsm8 [Anaeramoeba flamelloides]KAJ6229175.1 u6 snRNA-associated sm-like protein lsm8 [Anaeramoeba flamelloides]
MSFLEEYINKKVIVLTNDGKTIVGDFIAFDQTSNIALSKAIERVYSESKPVKEIELGVYITRGNNVCMVGLLNQDVDESLNFEETRATPIKVILD